MKLDDVLEQLKDIHRDIESDCGEDPQCVANGVSPLDDLKGFDSPLILTVVRMLAKKLGIVLSKGTRLKNPYVSADRTCKLSLQQVAARFCELYGTPET